MKLLTLKALFSFLILMAFANISFGQKVTTEEFLEEFKLPNPDFAENFEQFKGVDEAVVLKSSKQLKGELSKKSPIMVVKGGEHDFPTPYNIYKVEGAKEKIILELRSLGNMAGFKKTVFFPLKFVYNSKGEQINHSPILVYESRGADMKFPAHIYSLWTFVLQEEGDYYIVITSDNLYVDEVGFESSKGYVDASNVNKKGKGPLHTYPWKRSPYGKFKLSYLEK